MTYFFKFFFVMVFRRFTIILRNNILVYVSLCLFLWELISGSSEEWYPKLEPECRDMTSSFLSVIPAWLKFSLLITGGMSVICSNPDVFSPNNSRRASNILGTFPSQNYTNINRLIFLISLDMVFTNIQPDFQNSSKKLFHIDSEWLRSRN